MPKLSILLITFNHEKYIAQALESILMQETEFDYEINVVDDCSSDRTQEIILEYQRRHPDKIRTYFNSQNIGILDPPQQKVTFEGFKTLKGDYIALLEGDDYWTSPIKLQKQISFLEANPEFVACAHNTIKIYEDGSGKKPHRFLYRENEKKIHTLDDFLAMTSFFHLSATVYRNVFAGNPPAGFRSKWSCDVFNTIAHMQYGKLRYFDEDMAAYRCHTAGNYSQIPQVNIRIYHIDGLQHYNRWLGYRYAKELSFTLNRLCRDLLDDTKGGGLPPIGWAKRLKYATIGVFYGKLYDLIDRYPKLDPAVFWYKQPPKQSIPRPRFLKARKEAASECSINLQLFYCDQLHFTEKDSISIPAIITKRARVDARFDLPNAPRYLRLDVGHFFAVYEDPVLKIISASECETRDLDLRNCVDHHHNRQTLLQEDLLITGCDAGVTFENPFVGSDISIIFQAKFLYGIISAESFHDSLQTNMSESTLLKLEEFSKTLFKLSDGDSSYDKALMRSVSERDSSQLTV